MTERKKKPAADQAHPGKKGAFVRKKKLYNEIMAAYESVKKQLIDHFDPDKIIIFGSLASGNVNRFSDIDLIIIKKTRKSFKRRMNELYGTIDYSWPVDMLFYTPDEIERLKDRNMFLKRVLAEGKTVYEK